MKLLKLGFTGTQAGMTRLQKKELIHHLRRWQEKYELLEIHHGDCIGADAEFHEICISVWDNERLTIIVHPPSNESKRAFCEFDGQTVLTALPYLERNKAIVDAVDGMLAGPKETSEQLRSGTWSTVRYSRDKKKKPTIIMQPTRDKQAE